MLRNTHRRQNYRLFQADAVNKEAKAFCRKVKVISKSFLIYNMMHYYCFKQGTRSIISYFQASHKSTMHFALKRPIHHTLQIKYGELGRGQGHRTPFLKDAVKLPC